MLQKYFGQKFVFGIALTSMSLIFGYKEYTKGIEVTQNDEIKSNLLSLIRKKTNLTPMCISYTITAMNDVDLTSTNLVLSMFSSWSMIPEKMLLWLTLPEYQNLSVDEGKLIYGMFKVEKSSSDEVILSWKMLNLEGIHVYYTNKNFYKFQTIFWYNEKPPFILFVFHDIYSKILLASALKNKINV